MMESMRKWYRVNIDNYAEIYIKADINKIINLKKKKIYNKKKAGDLVGITIKPEFPKTPDIIIKNDFKKNTNELADKLISKISGIV